MKQSNPFLSIIIPAFNNKEDISKTINSIVENINNEDYEILVVDNNSTDGTKEEVLGLNLKNVCVLSCTTQGVSYARNTGIEHAKGKYITFSDADDVVDQNFANAVEVVAKNQDVDIFQFPVWVEEKQKELVGKLDDKFCNTVIESSSDLFLEFLDTKISNSSCNKFIRREFLNENKILYKQFTNAEDMEFVTRCLAKCKTWFNGERAYYHYLIRPNSAMTLVKINKVEDALNACNSAFLFAEENATEVVAKKLKNYVSRTAFFTLSRYAFLAKEDKKKCEKLVKQNMHLFQNAVTTKFKIIKLCFKILGVSLTLKLVGLIGK